MIIFFAGAFDCFASIENEIYITMALSTGVILYGVDNRSGWESGVALYNVPGELVKDGTANKTPARSPKNCVRNSCLPLDLGDGSSPSLKS
ncbi:unnamed protein product, partial [Tuber aestivum]